MLLLHDKNKVRDVPGGWSIASFWGVDCDKSGEQGVFWEACCEMTEKLQCSGIQTKLSGPRKSVTGIFVVFVPVLNRRHAGNFLEQIPVRLNI